MTTQVVAFFVSYYLSYLSENQHYLKISVVSLVFIKQLLSHGLYLFGSNLIHLLVEAVYVLLPAIVKEALAEVEGEVLAVVASHAYLSLNLLLGGLELRFAQRFLHEFIQLLANQSEAALHIVLIAAEINAP